MSNDLVKRLRTFRPVYGWPEEYAVIVKPSLGEEAADRIEALDKRNKELEAALREIKAMTPDPEFGTPPIENAINVARAALEGENE